VRDKKGGRSAEALDRFLRRDAKLTVSGRSTISVSVEHLEGFVGDVQSREVTSDIRNLDLLLPLSERVVDPSSELQTKRKKELSELDVRRSVLPRREEDSPS